MTVPQPGSSHNSRSAHATVRARNLLSSPRSIHSQREYQFWSRCLPTGRAAHYHSAVFVVQSVQREHITDHSPAFRIRHVDHVIDSLEIGGAEHLTLALARHQRSQGRAVRIHCLEARGPLADDATAEGIPVIDYEGVSPWHRRRLLFRAFRSASRLAVHCHNTAATIVAAPVARAAGARSVISTRHGLAAPDGAWGRELRFWTAARACTHVVAVCDAARRQLERVPIARPSRIRTIFNGVDFPPIIRRPPAGERVVAICVARLHAVKGHDDLLQAVARARPQVPQLELRLVGGGAEQQRLRHLACALGIAGHVQFLGEIHTVADALSDAHLFVLASQTEGVPLALLEGLAAGLVPIVTAVGGMPEVIRQAGVGAVVPPANVDALADALVTAVANRDRWSTWSEQATAAYHRHFTAVRMHADYDRLLDGGWPCQ